MPNETARNAALALATSNDELHLSSDERRLIQNFRGMKTSAGGMLLDLSEEYKRTLPVAPVKLSLL